MFDFLKVLCYNYFIGGDIMTLEILIAQYKETEEVIKPMLDSIAIQQGIDFNDINIIIANDGSNIVLSDAFLNQYNYNIEYYIKEHGGLSHTRNFLLDKSTADYILFCDADDMFLSVIALNKIFHIINTFEFDCLLPKFTVETKDSNGRMSYHPWFHCQVHGKVIRRQYLMDQNIRWDDRLITHDSRYFFVLVQNCTTPDRLVHIDESFYLWKYNKKSATRKIDNWYLNTYDYYTYSTDDLVDELLKRNKVIEASLIFSSYLYLTYFLYNSESWQNEDKQKIDKALSYASEFFQKDNFLLKFSEESLLQRAAESIRKDIELRQKTPYVEKISFQDFIRLLEH